MVVHRLSFGAPLIAILLYALACSTGCRAVATGRNVDGVRYFQQGQYPVAIQRFDSALTIDPKNPDSYYNKGAVLHRTGGNISEAARQAGLDRSNFRRASKRTIQKSSG